MVRTFIGLGSNIEDRLSYLQQAVRAIRRQVTVSAVSSVYETDPIGPAQPQFLNAACLAETELPPHDLLETLKRIEQDVGRSRSELWGPREIDLDLLLYGDLTVEEEGLVVPHPELTSRAFAMIPVLEIDPQVELPSGEPLSAFCEREPRGVIKTELRL